MHCTYPRRVVFGAESPGKSELSQDVPNVSMTILREDFLPDFSIL